jgi:MFS family permease
VSIDYLGSALLIAATVSIMLITIWGGSVHSWGSPLILGLVAAVFVLLALFVVQERRAPEPVVPLRLFAEPVFVIGSAVLLLTTSSLFVVNVFVPLYLQTAAGTSGTEAGLVLIPLIVATVTMQTICGRLISRTGRYRWFPPAGLLLMSAALALLSQVGTGTSRWLLAGYLVLFGLGFGMVTQVVIVAVQNAVGFRDLGVATASANFFRSLGGAIGTTIFGTAFATQATNLLPGVNALEIGPEQIRALPPTLRTEVTGAIGAAIDNVFLLAAPVALLGFLIALGLRDRPMLVFGGPPSGSAGRGPQTGAVAGAPSSAAGRAGTPASLVTPASTPPSPDRPDSERESDEQ